MAIIVMLKTDSVRTNQENNAMMIAQSVTALTSTLIEQHVTMEPHVQILLEVFHVHVGQVLLAVAPKTIDV